MNEIDYNKILNAISKKGRQLELSALASIVGLTEATLASALEYNFLREDGDKKIRDNRARPEV